MEREQQDDRDTGSDSVRAEEIGKASREVAVGVDRHAVDEVREPDTPDERSAEGCRSCSPSAQVDRQRGLSLFDAPLERDRRGR